MGQYSATLSKAILLGVKEASGFDIAILFFVLKSSHKPYPDLLLQISRRMNALMPHQLSPDGGALILGLLSRMKGYPTRNVLIISEQILAHGAQMSLAKQLLAVSFSGQIIDQTCKAVRARVCHSSHPNQIAEKQDFDGLKSFRNIATVVARVASESCENIPAQSASIFFKSCLLSGIKDVGILEPLLRRLSCVNTRDMGLQAITDFFENLLLFTKCTIDPDNGNASYLCTTENSQVNFEKEIDVRKIVKAIDWTSMRKSVLDVSDQLVPDTLCNVLSSIHELKIPHAETWFFELQETVCKVVTRCNASQTSKLLFLYSDIRHFFWSITLFSAMAMRLTTLRMELEASQVIFSIRIFRN